MPIAYSAPRSLTLYPLVRLADLASLAGAGLETFNFSDLQAATGFELREAQLTVTVLTTMGILVRTNSRREPRPSYAWAAEARPLVSSSAPSSHPGTAYSASLATFAGMLRDRQVCGRFTVFALECQAVSDEGAVHLAGEALVRVEGKKPVASDLVALKARLTQACGMPVSLSLQWLP